MDDVLDVTLEARLRPPALVVLSGRLLGVVGDLDEAAAAQPVEIAALAPDDRDEGALAAADERHERRQIEALVDPDLVLDRARQRERPPEIVESGGEDSEPVGAVALEVEVEV